MRIQLKSYLKNRILRNSIWMLIDKLYLLGLQFFIGIKIANLYGVTVYGTYALALSYIAFSSALIEMINSQILKTYYKKSKKVVFTSSLFYLGTSFFILGIMVFLYFQKDSFLNVLLLLLAIQLFFTNSILGIKNYFDYLLESSKIIIITNILATFSYMLQLYLLYRGEFITEILLIKIIESVLRGGFIFSLVKKKTDICFQFDFTLLKNIIKKSFYLWITYLSFLCYTQLDKIMIGNILGKKEVGVYSIAVSLANTTLIFTSPFMASIFPKMLHLFQTNYYQYIKKYQMLTFIVTQIYLFGGILSYFFLKWIFPYIFGPDYFLAVNTYGILMIAVIFKANSCFQTSHITIKNDTKMSFLKTLLGMMVNIVLNIYLIPTYGIYGAAIATSVTAFLSLFMIDFLILSYREHAWIQFRAFYRIK